MGISYQLYQLSERYQALMDRIDMQDGEVGEDDALELEITEDNLAENISEAYKAIKNIKCVINGLDEEYKAMGARIKRYKKIQDRISESLKTCLLRMGRDKGKSYGTDNHYAYITYTHPVEVNEEAAIEAVQDKIDAFTASLPDYYKVDVSVSKSNLGKRIDAGEVFNFAIKTDNANIQIK